MDILQLQHLVEKHPNISAATHLLKEIKTLLVKGLYGSSRAMFAVALFHKLPQTYLFILNDAESAGYFYHDITQITGTKDVLFFPSAYRRAAKYGQLDTANEVLRTETLSRLQSDDTPLIIVSYPDALAEKTVSMEQLKENTLKVSVGEQVDSAFVSEVLDSYGFQYVDYVYEPGQYATRGSILDVFSFSGEYPYRIDFFGDEIETIRNFDVETQLSKEKFSEIRIVPEFGRSGSRNSTLFDSLPVDAIIGIDDIRWIASRIESLNEDGLRINPQEADFVRADLVTKDDFLLALQPFRQLRFDIKMLETSDATIDFKTSPQPLYHKNFDLLSESAHRFLNDGYTLYLLSDS
jgi:transcription-repair coupling factor (superfamily II helicase)